MVSTYHLVKLLQNFTRYPPNRKGKSEQYLVTATNKVPSFLDSLLQKCRICLRQGDMPVFDNKNDGKTNLPLSLFLKIVCDIEITACDTYPQMLCKSCYNTLNETIKLRETAKKTELTLEKLNSLKEIDMKTQTKINDNYKPRGTINKSTLKSYEKLLTSIAPEKTMSILKKTYYDAKPIHTTQSKFFKIANNLAEKSYSKLCVIIPVRVTAGKYPAKQKEINSIISATLQEAQTTPEEAFPISSLNPFLSENLNVTQQANEIIFEKNENKVDEVNNLKLLQKQKNDKIDYKSTDSKKICTLTPTSVKRTVEKKKNDKGKCKSSIKEVKKKKEYSHLNLEDSNEDQQDEKLDLSSDEEWFNDILENSELLAHDKEDKSNNTRKGNKHVIPDSIKSESKIDHQMVESDEEWFKEITKDVKLKDTIDKRKRNNDSSDSESDEEIYFDRRNKNNDMKKKVSEYRKSRNLLKEKYLKEVLLMDNKRKFECQICHKILNRPYIHHVLLHLPEYKPQYLCEVCGKICHTRGSMYQHRFLHNKALPFKCELCPYRGRSREHLRQHSRMHSQDYRFLCSLCPRKFCRSQNLARHVRSHSEPKLKCTFCNKLFRENFQLKRHVKFQHTTVQPVSCAICGNIYKRRKHLLEHEIKVHNRKKGNKNNAIYLRLERAQES